MSDDLVAFLRARLDEDRTWAFAACANASGDPDVLADEKPIPWQGDHRKIFVAGRHAAAEATSVARATHIARHDPARVLAEVEAKREALRQYERLLDISSDDASGITALETVIRAFAAAHDGHPDYREEWRP